MSAKSAKEQLPGIAKAVFEFFTEGKIPDEVAPPPPEVSTTPRPGGAVPMWRCATSCPRCAGAAKVVQTSGDGTDVIVRCPNAKRGG